jgi:hypothetical protein
VLLYVWRLLRTTSSFAFVFSFFQRLTRVAAAHNHREQACVLHNSTRSIAWHARRWTILI